MKRMKNNITFTPIALALAMAAPSAFGLSRNLPRPEKSPLKAAALHLTVKP